MLKKTIALAMSLCLAGLALYFRVPVVAYHGLRMAMSDPADRAGAIWLPDYAVEFDARPIDGVEGNLSALTFNRNTGTLFAVINRPAAVIELDQDGRLLRHIPLDGLGDPEGITHIEDNLFALSDERAQHIVLARIDPGTTRIDTRGAPRLSIALDLRSNLGFEGLSWDETQQRLLVVKEKSPLRVLEIRGLLQPPGAVLDLSIDEWKPSRKLQPLLRDLSSLTLHDASGHLLLLSHESKMVVEYDADGSLVSLMSLWRGWHGLHRSVPQAEGIALDDQNRLYVVSEPNLFYRFSRQPAAPTAP